MKQKANQTIAFLVAVFLLLIGTETIAQSNAKSTTGDPAKGLTSSKDYRYQAAVQELRNFKHDPNNRNASQIHYNLLKERMELEKQLLADGISKASFIEINNQIEMIVKQLNDRDFSTENSFRNIMITDNSFENYSSGELEFITLEDFKKLSPEKQNVITTNPARYRIAEHNELMPKNNFRKVNTETGAFDPAAIRLQNLTPAEFEALNKVEERYALQNQESSSYEYDVKKSELEVIKKELQLAEASGNLTNGDRQAMLDKIALFESEVAKLKQIHAPEKSQFKQ